MQSRPRAVSAVMGVLFALAGAAIASAVAAVIRYNDTAARLAGYQQETTDKVAQAGVDLQFTHLPAVAIGPTIMVVGVLLALAAGLVALAIALRLPRPRARVVAFIAAGAVAILALAQAGIALTQQLTLNQILGEYRGMRESLVKQFPGLESSSSPYAGLSSSGFEDLFPTWPYYVDYLTSAVAVAGCAAVVVLLTRRAARTWFAVTPSAPPQQWEAAAGGEAPSAPRIDTRTIISDPWLRSIVSELLSGPRSLEELTAGPLGTNPEVLNWRLWDLYNADVVSQSPSSIYALTPYGQSIGALLGQPGLQG
ncbi:hypothetical protein [Amycolatopsis sp. cmx-8-4]|uniref:hypothetical protein n=1 Tax=Amycolatopsis sp. cmx-8-4 TaxID=2790947 RepID=UPI00397DE419